MVTPTKEQARIRDHQELALLITAPAGCGKTEALALRVAGLLQRDVTVGHRRILVTTFSNRAMDNVRDRLRSYLPAASLRDRVTVTNFHGLSARIFRSHASTIDLDPAMTIPESDWVREQCHSRGWNWTQIGATETALSEAKRQPLNDIQVEQQLRSKNATCALLLEQERLAQNHLTYDDLPRLAELILAREEVAALYRNHFAALIVDEYQDLTPQQLHIVNYLGWRKTTYAGDLAQGIYGFAGAQPLQIDAAIRRECAQNTVEFAESHRSSPAVLNMVNALNDLTGGLRLTSARPEAWPHGGLAAVARFETPEHEAQWAAGFAREVLEHDPTMRVGIVCRNASRRSVADRIIAISGLPFFRWDDGTLDTETARVIKVMLVRLNAQEALASDDSLQYLRKLAEHEAIVDPDTRKAVAEALVWCLDLLRDGLQPLDIRNRIQVGDHDTLLTAPGVHLLSGHVGKGQQFDWVVVIGAEDGVIPDWRSNTNDERLEDARVLSVMVSRARHGVVVSCAKVVTTVQGKPKERQPSKFFTQLRRASPTDLAGVRSWFDTADWNAIKGQ